MKQAASGTRPKMSSDEDLADRRSVIDVQSFAARNLELSAVKPHQVQHAGVHVGDVMPRLDCMETKFVSGSMNVTTFDAGT